MMNGSEVCGSPLSYGFQRVHECVPLRLPLICSILLFSSSSAVRTASQAYRLRRFAYEYVMCKFASPAFSRCCALSKRLFTYSIILILNESHNEKLKQIFFTGLSSSTILSVHTYLLLYCTQWLSNLSQSKNTLTLVQEIYPMVPAAESADLDSV